MLISFLALVALVNADPRPGRAEHAADPRLGVRADRLEPRRAVARRADDRQPARHAHGAQRVRRLLAARPAEGDARPEVVHHRHLRAVRLRQLQLDRHPDRRHRRAGARAAARPGPARRCGRCSPARSPTSSPRPSRACCCERGRVRRASTRRRRPSAPAAATCRTSPSCSARASATSPTRLADAVRRAVRDAPALAGSRRVVGHAGRLVVGRPAAERVAALSGRAHVYEGHADGHGRLRDPRDGAARRHAR